MALKCPKCQTVLEVRLTAAPPMQADTAGPNPRFCKLLEQVNDDLLEPGFETQFIANLRERFAQYGERTLMSGKQMASLRKIAGK